MFLTNMKFAVPYAQAQKELKLFSFFPEAKYDLIRFCNEQVKEGTMLTEIVLSELK